MTSDDIFFLDAGKLRVGLFVELDVGWMSHPFPTGSFKLSTPTQIDAILGLGLKRVRCVRSKSDGEALSTIAGDTASTTSTSAASTYDPVDEARKLAALQAQEDRRRRAELLAGQARGQAVCERRFGEAARQYRKTLEVVKSQPKAAAAEASQMINTIVGEMMSEGESAIRLLTEAAGDKSSMHPVNVTIVSLLLGKAMGLDVAELQDLGVAAFLHDIGKMDLPDRVRWLDDSFSTAEYKLYQDHVAKSVGIGKTMELSRGALLTLSQHHELVDGSGFPSRAKGDTLSAGARILALINRYDNLCNPSRLASALTPHEALSQIFAQMKSKFDTGTLSAFIRMMGVYPPGSIVQLIDERYGMVVSVNSARPLKPRIIVHESGVTRDQALILDLEQVPSVGIRRSLKPSLLPAASLDFLAPRQRISYFFEKVVDPHMREAVS
jgi:HD-GYP domain-containing protein (c-di-GMP phosphodiesterase class II)